MTGEPLAAELGWMDARFVRRDGPSCRTAIRQSHETAPVSTARYRLSDMHAQRCAVLLTRAERRWACVCGVSEKGRQQSGRGRDELQTAVREGSRVALRCASERQWHQKPRRSIGVRRARAAGDGLDRVQPLRAHSSSGLHARPRAEDTMASCAVHSLSAARDRSSTKALCMTRGTCIVAVK